MIATRAAGLLAAVLGVGLLSQGSGCGSGGGNAGAGGIGGHATSPSSSSGGGAAPLCVPGAQAACACIGGSQGVQVCKDDGAGYGACEGCPSGTGGAPGTGGGPGTGGAGGAPSTTTSSSSSSSSSSSGSSIPCPGGPTEIDLHLATIYDNPPDLADWPVTTTLTEVDFTNDGVALDFSKKDGQDRWPDVVPPGWDGPLEYTLGMVECIDGQWYASAAIEFWYGLPASGGNIALNDQVAVNWFYDAIRWGKLAGRQPATGETIGIFVAAGNLRAVHTDDPAQSPVMERSNVVLVPMPDVNGANHSF